MWALHVQRGKFMIFKEVIQLGYIQLIKFFLSFIIF